MKISLVISILILNLLQVHLFSQTKNISVQDTIGYKKNYVKFIVYRGIESIKLCVIIDITPELKNTLTEYNNTIKKISQKDSFIVFTGVIYSYPFKYFENDGKKIKVPNNCYSVVVSLYTHKLIQCVLFDNSNNPAEKIIPLNELEYKTKFYFERILRFTIKQ